MKADQGQEIRPLTDAEVESIDAGCQLGLRVLQRYGHDGATGFSPAALDAALAAWRADAQPDRPDEDAIATGLGCLFGRHMRQSLGGSFVMVTDAMYGTSFGVDAGTVGIAYPIDSVRKRLDSPEGTLTELFEVIRQQHATAANRPGGMATPLDLDKVYPFIVPAGYFGNGPRGPLDPTGLIVPVGQGAFATIVMDLNGMCRTVSPSELPLNLPAKELHARAVANLEALVRNGGVQWQMMQDAAGTPSMLRCYGSWLAAACCRLPNLVRFARQHLRCEEVCVSIPQREEMLLFPKGNRASRDRLREQIYETEKDAERPITFGLFLLTETGMTPLNEE